MKNNRLEILKKHRFENIKKRKNFFPTLIITIFLWFGLISIILFVDPFAVGALELFLALFFLSVFFLASLIFGSSRRGLLFSIGTSTYLLLKYLNTATPVGLIIIAVSLILLEIYLKRKS